MAKNKKKSTSSLSRGQGSQFSDLTQNANSIFAVEAPHAFAEKNQFSNSIAGGSSPHKFLIQDDRVVACGSGSESREEDELVYTEPEDGIRSGPSNAHSPTSSPARGINNAGSEGTSPGIVKSGDFPAGPEADTQAQPTAPIELNPVTSKSSDHTTDEDLGSSCDVWKSCIVGYVAGEFPGFKALNSIIANTWHCEASLSIHESGWLVFKFNNVDDKVAVLAGGPYLVYRRPLILKSMPEYFDFSPEERTKVPVWVKFPNLPLECWSIRCLSKIASVIGKPIQTDRITASMSRISYARVLVELDLLDELTHAVDILLPNGTTLKQSIVYETLPRFCKLCKALGHATGACSKTAASNESGKMDSRTAHNKSCSKQESSASLEPVVGTSVQKDERKAVIAEQHFDPMQTELDVISEEWETVRGRKNRESSGKDLPAEDICREQGAAVSNSLKGNLKTPLGRKNRGIAAGSGRESPTSPTIF